MFVTDADNREVLDYTIKLVGLNAADVELMRWDNNLYITILATSERIQVNNQWALREAWQMKEKYEGRAKGDQGQTQTTCIVANVALSSNRGEIGRA